ncbi:MAG: cupredoxin domain-containing protein [Candidatus Aenigmarchaeota archaeon]|nr:cupredoxin domain-containing protein [Candidatus Aenigmarchaeota archaeon]
MATKDDVSGMVKIIGPAVILLFIIAAASQIYINSAFGSTGNAVGSVERPLDNGDAIADNAAVKEVKLQFKDYNYYPNKIYAKQGQKVRIVGDLESENKLIGCYSFVRIPALGIAKRLTPEDRTIEFTAGSPGTIPFSCGMNMGKGQIIVQA